MLPDNIKYTWQHYQHVADRKIVSFHK